MITLDIEKSKAWGRLQLQENGRPVPVEQAIEKGFYIGRDDAPAALTLLTTVVVGFDREDE